MNRLDKAFIGITVLAVFLIFAILFPFIVLVPLITFLIGLGVGGGMGIFSRIYSELFKQFRKPEKTHTPMKRAKKAKGRPVERTKPSTK